MASVVISLIYKEKGHRYDLSRYRPIAVMAVLYKIMARCMADVLQPSLAYLISRIWHDWAPPPPPPPPPQLMFCCGVAARGCATEAIGCG